MSSFVSRETAKWLRLMANRIDGGSPPQNSTNNIVVKLELDTSQARAELADFASVMDHVQQGVHAGLRHFSNAVLPGK